MPDLVADRRRCHQVLEPVPFLGTDPRFAQVVIDHLNLVCASPGPAPGRPTGTAGPGFPGFPNLPQRRLADVDNGLRARWDAWILGLAFIFPLLHFLLAVQQHRRQDGQHLLAVPFR